MEPLARIDLFDLDNTTSTATYCVDGVYSKPAIVDTPRHYQLSHYLTSDRAIPAFFWRQRWSLQKHYIEMKVRCALLR